MSSLFLCYNSFKTAVITITAFGTINDDATKSGKALVLFHKKLSDIISDIQTSGLKNGLSGIFGNDKISLINDGDIDRVNEYFSLIDSGIDKNTALQSSLKGASSATKQIAVTTSSAAEAQQAMAYAVKNVTIAEKAAIIGTKALSAALNAALVFGVTMAINGLIKVVDNYVTTAKEASEQQEKLREQVAENTRAFQEETDAIEGLLSKYVTLVSQNTDLSAVEKDLTEIQNQLIDAYGVEADSIDLLNGKLSENVAMMRERKRELAEEYVYNEDNRKAYDDAVFNLEAGKGSTVSTGFAETKNFWKLDLEGWIEEEAIKAWSDAGLNFSAQISKIAPTDLFAYGDLDEKKNTWLKMAEIYKTIDGYSEVTYNQLMEYYEGAKRLQSELTSTKNQMERNRSFLEFEDTSEFDALIDKAKELNQTMQGDGTVTERYAASRELESLKNEIYQLAESNTELKNEADTVFAAFEAGSSNAITSTADLEKAFYESLDDMQKGSLKNIELIENAMQTLANGKYVPWDDFFDIKELDTDDVLSIPEQIGNELKMNIQELQQLKDNYVVDPIIESLQKENQSIQDQIDSTNGVVNGLKDQLEYELLILDAQIAQGANSASEDNLIREQKKKVQEIRDKIKDYGDQIERNNLLIKMLNTHLGDTVDKTEMLKNQMEKIRDISDNYAKAMTAKIDSIIDSHEAEKDVLEKEKEVLNEQLDTLEEQQKAIEDILDNYKSVVDIVGDVTDKEIDLLKKQQESEENAVQTKIDALKEAREQQEEENTLTEKQLALQEKLRDLEKARQTKVRTYSSERGWHFDVDKEAVANAQTAVDEAQADYDKAVDDKVYNDQLSALEKEKELITENFESQIKAYEDYYDEWKAILDEQTESENEQIAQQILGAEWREKIKNKDTEVLNKFKSNFQSYNTQLNNLINTEIANLKLSIKAKEDEIEAIGKQISEWNKYKDEVNKAISDIKSANEDYTEFMNQIMLNEESNFYDREVMLWNFKETYKSYLDEIIEKQAEMDNLSAEEMERTLDRLGNVVEIFDEWTNRWNKTWQTQNELHLWNSAFAVDNVSSHAKGGVVDHTGLAMLHGEKQRPEVIFNAAQSKQLYDMVMKGDFADLAAARAAEGFTSVLKSIESARTFNKNINNTNNSNTSSIVIQHMDINGVQNPAQFANEFNKNMEQYLRNVYAESLVK